MTEAASFLLPYFAAERQEAMLFVAVGAAAVAAAAWLTWRVPRWRGAAWPLVAIAAIQIVVGGSVGLRTDAQVATLAARLAADPAAFKREETARMLVVNDNFRVYKAIEIGLVAAGVALVAANRRPAQRPRRAFWRAFGAGLALQAAFMLALDFFAEERAGVYTAQVDQL